MVHILKDKNIVSKILTELSDLCAIPDNGFLAGGAVANTLLSMKYGKPYPINDLDIFIESEDVTESLHTLSEGGTPTRTQTLVIQSGYNEGELGYDHGSNYRILEVDRDGLLNWITISRVNNRDNIRNYRYILNGFDFNCCQVGIDLKTNELYYTDEFEEFLNTKQLDVTAIYTPAHTAIRLFKKRKELDCYCDVEKCMELLSQPLIHETRLKLSPRHFGIYFSHKYRDMFVEHYKELKEYFKMVRFFDDKKDLWKLNNVINDPFCPLVSSDEQHVTNWLNPENSIPTEILEKWSSYNDIMWTLLPKKYNTPNVKVTEILSTVVYNPLTFMGSYKLVNGKLKKVLSDKCDIVLNKGKWTKLLTLLNPYYCDCDFSEEHINVIELFLSKYPSVLSSVTRYKLSLQETLQLVKTFNKVISEEGEWVEVKITEILYKGNTTIKPTYESIVNTLKVYKSEMDKPLVEEIKFLKEIKLPKGVSVKELVSEIELHWAGNKLKNCINNPDQGYIEKIKSDSVKVIVISTPHSTSALELHIKPEDIMYVEKQLLSTCNKKPSSYHRILADIIKAELNSDLLKSQYEIRLKLYKDVSLLNRGMLVSVEDKKTDNNDVEMIDPLFWPE